MPISLVKCQQTSLMFTLSCTRISTSHAADVVVDAEDVALGASAVGVAGGVSGFWIAALAACAVQALSSNPAPSFVSIVKRMR